jgi:hypothetical protein
MTTGQQLVWGPQATADSASDREAPVKDLILSVKPFLQGARFVRGRPRPDSSELEFDFEVEMAETGRSVNELEVKFSFWIGKAVTGQRCELDGKAEVAFSHLTPSFDLQFLGEEQRQLIAIEIYRALYEMIYLLHATMGMDIPSPWILNDVSLLAGEIESP